MSQTKRVLQDLTQRTVAKPSITLGAGFDAKNIKVLLVKNPTTQIWAYENDYKGKTYFHVREVYQTTEGEWKPGKGLSMKADDKMAFIHSLVG